MNTENAADTDIDRRNLERRRDLVLRRLLPVIDAIDRKRHAVTDAVERVVPSRAELASVPRRDRAIFVAAGVVAGAAVFTLASWASRWRSRRDRPINRIVRALTGLAPRRPSLFKAVIGAVGPAILSRAAELVGAHIEGMLRDTSNEPIELDLPDVLRISSPDGLSPLSPPTLPGAAPRSP